MKLLITCLVTIAILSKSYIYSQDALFKIEIPHAETENSFLLDGTRNASFWARSFLLPPLQIDEAVHSTADNNCQIEVVENNTWIIIGITVKEPKNIIAREYMHNEAQWFDDNVIFNFTGKDNISVQTNPLGALVYSINEKQSMEPITHEKLKVCARIHSTTWRSEIAIHKSILGEDLSKIPFKIIRQRQHRGYEPYQTSSQSLILNADNLKNDTKELFALERQTFENLTIFNSTFKIALPEKPNDWEEIPSQELTLSTGNNFADPDFQKTNIKMAVNNEEISILIECAEKNMNVLFKDETSIANDSIELYLNPDGFRYFQVAITPEGKMSAHIGLTGGRRVRSIPVPASAKCTVIKNENSWVIQYKINIKEIIDFAGAPATYTPTAFPWQFQVIRNRGYRKLLGQNAQESQLAINNSATAHCPIRFARIIFSTSKAHSTTFNAKLPMPVFSNEEKVQKGLTELLRVWVKDQSTFLHSKVQDRLVNIKTKEEWLSFKNEMVKNILRGLFPNSDGNLPKKIDTKATIVYTFEKDDVIVKGIIFRSRKNIPVTGTLYLPKDFAARKNMPAMIMIPAHHTPRNCGDIYCLAKNLTDQGCLAIAIDTLGSGERGIAARWNHKNHQRNLIGHQLTLVGEEITGWALTDIISTVDYLYERKDVDISKIAVIGGVAGGGDIAALSGAIDERITVTIPFNFSSNNPIGGWYDLTRSFPLSHYFGMTHWIVSSLIAPRKLIDAQEFAWTEDREKEFQHFAKIYDFYQVKDSLAKVHGDTNTHASSFLSLHRVGVYHILNNWWGLQLPTSTQSEKKFNLQDGHLEVSPYKEAKIFLDTYYKKDLKSNLDSSAYMEPNFLAEEIGKAQRKKFQSTNKKDFVKKALEALFKDTTAFETTKHIGTIDLSSKWPGSSTVNIWIPLEEKLSNGSALMATAWLISDLKFFDNNFPLVICLSQEGKNVFFQKREQEIKSFVNKGYAVAIVDVRGIGETEVTSFRLPESDTATLGLNLCQMQDSLLGRRIKDTKTIIKVLSTLPHILKDNITLWGEGFSEPNGKEGDIFKFEETGFRQAGPGGKRLCEPLGMNLALLTPLLLDPEFKVKRVIARGGLISYESILNDFYYYLPSDTFIPGLLTKIDLPDVIEALSNKGIKLYLEDVRDGKNRVISKETLQKIYHDKVNHYQSNISKNLVEQILNEK